MNATYTWLYEHYARDLQDACLKAEDQVLHQLADEALLTSEIQVLLADYLADLRFLWGSESFALGVRFGLGLAGDLWNGED